LPAGHTVAAEVDFVDRCGRPALPPAASSVPTPEPSPISSLPGINPPLGGASPARGESGLPSLSPSGSPTPGGTGGEGAESGASQDNAPCMQCAWFQNELERKVTLINQLREQSASDERATVGEYEKKLRSLTEALEQERERGQRLSRSLDKTEQELADKTQQLATAQQDVAARTLDYKRLLAKHDLETQKHAKLSDELKETQDRLQAAENQNRSSATTSAQAGQTNAGPQQQQRQGEGGAAAAAAAGGGNGGSGVSQQTQQPPPVAPTSNDGSDAAAASFEREISDAYVRHQQQCEQMQLIYHEQLSERDHRLQQLHEQLQWLPRPPAPNMPPPHRIPAPFRP